MEIWKFCKTNMNSWDLFGVFFFGDLWGYVDKTVEGI